MQPTKAAAPSTEVTFDPLPPGVSDAERSVDSLFCWLSNLITKLKNGHTQDPTEKISDHPKEVWITFGYEPVDRSIAEFGHGYRIAATSQHKLTDLVLRPKQPIKGVTMVLRWPAEDNKVPLLREALIHFYESALCAPHTEPLNLKQTYDSELGVVKIDFSLGSAPSPGPRAQPMAAAEPSAPTVPDAEPDRAPAGTEIMIEEGWSPAEIADAVTFADYLDVPNATAQIRYQFDVLSAPKPKERVKGVSLAASSHLKMEVEPSGRGLAVHAGEGLKDVVTHLLQFAKDNIGPHAGIRAFVEEYGVRIEVSGSPATSELSTSSEGRPVPDVEPTPAEDQKVVALRTTAKILQLYAEFLQGVQDWGHEVKAEPGDFAQVLRHVQGRGQRVALDDFSSLIPGQVLELACQLCPVPRLREFLKDVFLDFNQFSEKQAERRKTLAQMRATQLRKPKDTQVGLAQWEHAAPPEKLSDDLEKIRLRAGQLMEVAADLQHRKEAAGTRPPSQPVPKPAIPSPVLPSPKPTVSSAAPQEPENPLVGERKERLQQLKAAAKALEDLVDILRKPRPLPTEKEAARASVLAKRVQAGNGDIRDKNVMIALAPSDILRCIYSTLVQPAILFALPESDPLREIWNEEIGEIQRAWPRLLQIDEHFYSRKAEKGRLEDMRTIQRYERMKLSPDIRKIEAEMNRLAGIPGRGPTSR